MAPPAAGRKFKQSRRPKNDARSLKRKRDVNDHEQLQKAVAELVSLQEFTGEQKFTFLRI